MTEPAATATEPTAAPATETTEPAAPDTGANADPAAEAEKWKALAQKHEQRAKANAEAAKELENLRRQSMSDVEKAAAEAEERGMQKARETFGQRLVRSEFTAAAARANPEFDVAAVLDDLNLVKFIGEDGEPDVKEIQKAVERLVPAAGNRPPSYDGGTRTAAPAAFDFNQQIRQAAGRA